MKKTFLLFLAVCIFLASSNAQIISPEVSNEHCANQEIIFAVTVNGTNPNIVSSTNNPIIVRDIYNSSYNSNTGITTFNFVGKFRDVNVAQTFVVTYISSSGTISYPFTFKKIKSLFYNNDRSCSYIASKTNPITAPLCTISNIPISFDAIRWFTFGESSPYCFGSITDYEYMLPSGWSLNGVPSTGNNWISGSNSVTVTSDYNTGGSILVRPANKCGANMQNGQTPVQIHINRPPNFTLTASATSIPCGSTSPITFTANSKSGGGGVTGYTWNLGATPNGWLLPDGSPAPATYATASTVNTLTLSPVCGKALGSVSAVVLLGGSATCATNAVAISATMPYMAITGDALFCSSSSDYFVSILPCSATVDWNVSSGAVRLSTNANNATLTRLNNDMITLTAKITSCSTVNLSKVITVGEPNEENITYGSTNGTGTMQGVPFFYNGSTYWKPYENKYFEFESLDGHFIFPNPANELGSNPPFNAKGAEMIVDTRSGSGGNSIYVRVRAVNDCGESQWRYINIPLNTGYFYVISPNPTSETVTIGVREENAAAVGITSVTLFDEMSAVKKQARFSAGTRQAKLNVAELKAGLYFLEVANGEKKERQQLLIQK